MFYELSEYATLEVESMPQANMGQLLIVMASS
jgi:hypothetical protein